MLGCAAHSCWNMVICSIHGSGALPGPVWMLHPGLFDTDGGAPGADLDPRAVLDALGEAVPLSVALPTLGRMIRERTHRVRQGCLLRNLHRSCHLQAAASRVEVRLACRLVRVVCHEPCCSQQCCVQGLVHRRQSCSP